MSHTADVERREHRTNVVLHMQVQGAGELGPPMTGRHPVTSVMFQVGDGDGASQILAAYDLAWDRLMKMSRIDLDLAA